MTRYMSTNKGLEHVHVSPFNTALESSLRVLCILYEGYPAKYDSQRLVFFDYLIVHSGDVAGGPTSLHPATPFRSNEWLVRRQLVDRGVRLLMERGLVSTSLTDKGIMFGATEMAGAFVACLTETYTMEMKARAQWVVQTFGDTDEAELLDLFDTHLDRWGAEFQPIEDWEDKI